MDKIKEIIISIIKSKHNLPTFDINAQTHLRNDLGFDSLDLAELTVKIEDEFDVDVFKDGIVETVGEIISKLDN
jgi:acyl carrier protein